MIRSMTGFGRASGTAAAKWNVAVTVRSVNHKYLELGVRLPEQFWELEQPVRALVSSRAQRGKVDVSIRLRRVGEQESSVRVNRHIANAVVPQLTLLLAELGHGVRVGLGDLVRIPGLVEVEAGDETIDDEDRAAIMLFVEEALEQLQAMRATEGESLANDIRSRAATVARLREQVIEELPLVRQETTDTFRRRIEEIRSDTGLEVPEDRIAQELALMIERGDVAEELTRLESHLSQLDTLLATGGAIGKKLDFLAQEMLREVNTMGQKSRAVSLRRLTMELKAEIERIREQVQNVE